MSDAKERKRHVITDEQRKKMNTGRVLAACKRKVNKRVSLANAKCEVRAMNYAQHGTKGLKMRINPSEIKMSEPVKKPRKLSHMQQAWLTHVRNTYDGQTGKKSYKQALKDASETWKLGAGRPQYTEYKLP